jgi:subtilase family serine protease
MTPGQQALARRLAREIEDPASARYHRFLTATRYAASFGASAVTIAEATSWLEAHGLEVHGAAATGARLLFGGNVGQVEDAFQTQVHRYDLRGKRHFALAVQPTYPPELAASVLGLHGAHDFRTLSALHGVSETGELDPNYILGLGPDGGTEGMLALAPSDFANIYDVAPLYSENVTGMGQTIAIVGDSDFSESDVASFRTTFGLDASNLPTKRLVPFSGNPVFASLGEAELDVEWSGAVARDAHIDYVFVGDNLASSTFDSILYAIEAGTYPVISSSFLACEAGETPNDAIFLATMGNAAAMEGTTIVNASGDLGAAACDDGVSEVAAQYGPSVNWPAAVPSIVAAGGSEFNWGDPVPEGEVTTATGSLAPFSTYWQCSASSPLTCNANGYVPETGWNDTTYEIANAHQLFGASGGGQSAVYPKPYWQIGQTPSGGTRQLPDVALSASAIQVGYVVASSGVPPADGGVGPVALYRSGGTSAAAPAFAGILALVNQSLAKANPSLPPGLGNANPVLYALASSTSGTGTPVFHDITSGSNIVPCQVGSPGCPSSPPYQFGFVAGPGYDMVTGLGSLDAFNLATAWKQLVPTSTTATVTPTGTTEGTPLALSAAISSSATSTPLTGAVVFYLETTSGDGGAAPELTLTATAIVTPTTSGGKESATASASAIAPPGSFGGARVVAFYGGDSHYLASWSVPSTVAVASSLAVTPSAVTLRPNEQYTFQAAGGAAPEQWIIDSDSACDANYDCSEIESLTATSAAFQAGPVDGTTVISAIDADGAEVSVTIAISGAAIDGGVLPPQWDGSFPVDGADDATAAEDATVDARASDASASQDATASTDAAPFVDARTTDGAGDQDDAGRSPGPSGGCGCVAAGRSDSTPGGGYLCAVLAATVALRLPRRPRRSACPR